MTVFYRLSNATVSFSSPFTTSLLTSIRRVISSISSARFLVFPAMPAIPLAPSSMTFVMVLIESAMPDMEVFRCLVRS